MAESSSRVYRPATTAKATPALPSTASERSIAAFPARQGRKTSTTTPKPGADQTCQPAYSRKVSPSPRPVSAPPSTESRSGRRGAARISWSSLASSGTTMIRVNVLYGL